MTTNSTTLNSRLLGVSACCLALIPLGAGAVTTFTGANGSDVTDVGNWDNGLPDNVGNSAIIPNGSVTTYTGTGDLNFNGTWEGNSTLTGTNSRIDDGVLTFNGTSSYNVGATVIALARDGGVGIININDSASVFGDNDIKIGRGGAGTFNVNGGSLETTIDLEFGNQPNAGTGVVNLTAGSVTVGGVLIYATGYAAEATNAFNFTLGSTGILTVLNGGADYTTDFETFITNGDIQLGGSSASIGDFAISYSGTSTSIQVIPEPTTGVLALLGAACLLRRRRC